jgi:hypothetical protein
MTAKSLALCALLAFAASGAETGTVNVFFEGASQLRDHPVMISAVRDGQVVGQQETALPSSRRLDPLEAGVYDIRVEGDGLVTQVKKGVHVFAGKEIELHFNLRQGQGVRVVEYATGGLSREEVAARLAKLETAVKDLQTNAAQPR